MCSFDIVDSSSKIDTPVTACSCVKCSFQSVNIDASNTILLVEGLWISYAQPLAYFVMINYILLVSRQGSSHIHGRDNKSHLTLKPITRKTTPCKMVYNDGPKSQGQDRQGRYPAGLGSAHADV